MAKLYKFLLAAACISALAACSGPDAGHAANTPRPGVATATPPPEGGGGGGGGGY